MECKCDDAELLGRRFHIRGVFGIVPDLFDDPDILEGTGHREGGGGSVGALLEKAPRLLDAPWPLDERRPPRRENMTKERARRASSVDRKKKQRMASSWGVLT